MFAHRLHFRINILKITKKYQLLAMSSRNSPSSSCLLIMPFYREEPRKSELAGNDYTKANFNLPKTPITFS